MKHKLYIISILFNLVGIKGFSQSIAPAKAEVLVTTKQSISEQMNDAMEAQAMRQNAWANQDRASAGRRKL
jgi:hypothetical protein